MISKINMQKKAIWTIAIILLALIVGIAALNIYSNSTTTPDLTRTEYRMDTQPLIDRFGATITIESCFWKADAYSNRGIGPSSYWIKGFVLLNKASFEAIQSQYNLSTINLHFENGMEPRVTGFTEFEWAYDKELSREISGAGFIGEFYVDVKNGILYFDLESN